MAISAPVITTPYNGDNFTTNQVEQYFTGTVPTGATAVFVNNLPATIVGLTWSITVTLAAGNNTVSIYATDGFAPSPTVTITINRVTSTLLIDGITVPTGILVSSSLQSMVITWAEAVNDNMRGYNIYYSKTARGGELGYTRLNDALISQFSGTKDVVSSSATKTVTDSGIRTTTTTENTRTVKQFTLDVADLRNGDTMVEGETIYFVIRSVTYDSALKRELESLDSEEVYGELIAIDASGRELVRRIKSEIQADYTLAVLDIESEADVKPGSVADNLFVGPISDEFERMYFMQDYFGRAQSFPDLLALDDADNDGVSDPVGESAYKQSLGIVLGFTTEQQVQDFIDASFDILATRVNIKRKSAEAAQGTVILYTTKTTT